MPIGQLQHIVYASLMAALIAVGAYIHIPIGPVPIVLQNLFVFLAGLLLGARWGLASMGIYLLVGALGIPVFSGGRGGIAHFMGPTGGYLIGYVVAVFLAGFISQRLASRRLGDAFALAAAVLAVYAFGVPWLKFVTGMTWAKAWVAGMAPFLPGDVLKAFAAFLPGPIAPAHRQPTTGRIVIACVSSSMIEIKGLSYTYPDGSSALEGHRTHRAGR